MSYELAYLWALRRPGLRARVAPVDMVEKAWFCIGQRIGLGILDVTSSHTST